MNDNSQQTGTGFWAIVQSVLSAGLGVQSRANRERDFARGRPIHFVVGGLIGTVVFIAFVLAIVRYFIASS